MKKYESKESRINLAKELAKESIILLKNQNTILPLDLDKEVAVFGRFQLETLIGGSGGEECDRRVEEDYYLTQSEKQMIELVGKHFNDVILILNINGYIDLSWVSDYPSIKGIIYMGTAGEQGASALAEVLVGEINPSGKLAGTIACSYDDYPSSEYFVTNKDRPDEIPTYEDYGLSAQENKSYGFDKSPVALYQEGIYVGYRYFDTFNKEVLYPFGFGMSYTNFEIQYDDSYIKEQNLILSINVVNKGSQYSGKEVVQVYVSAPEGRIEKPYQELITEVCKNRLTLLEENKDKLEFLSQGESDNQLRNKLSSDKVLCTLEAFAINTKEDHPVKEVDQSIEN